MTLKTSVQKIWKIYLLLIISCNYKPLIDLNTGNCSLFLLLHPFLFEPFPIYNKSQQTTLHYKQFLLLQQFSKVRSLQRRQKVSTSWKGLKVGCRCDKICQQVGIKVLISNMSRLSLLSGLLNQLFIALGLWKLHKFIH